MTIVVDTSILIDHLRGDARAQRLLESGPRAFGTGMAASALSRVEILAGMRQGEESETHALFAAIEWIGVDEPIADRAGELANRFFHSHPGIDPVDYVIAATAQTLDAELWTSNLKHFPMFPGLETPY